MDVTATRCSTRRSGATPVPVEGTTQMTTRRHRPALGIVELAVDPADVDQETYPVRLRLTRPLTAYEADGLASVDPGIRSEGDAIVLPAARQVSTSRATSSRRAHLERVQTRADQREGETLVADQRRVDDHARHGSHLRSQQVNDRGLH